MSIDFTVDGKTLTGAMSTIAKLVGGKSDVIDISVVNSKKGEYLLLHAKVEMNVAVFKLTKLIKVRKPGIFSINRSTMEGIFRGRSVLTIKIDETGLSFKDAKSDYAGKGITLLPSQVEEIVFEPPKSSKIPEKLQASLLQQLSAVTIASSMGGDTSIGVHIVVKNNQLIVAAADNLHAAITVQQLEKADAKQMGDFNTIIPVEYVSMLSAFEAKNLQISVGSDAVRVSNDEINASFPAFQVDNKVDIDGIMNITEDKKPTLTCRINGSRFGSVLDNMQIVHEQGEATRISFKRDKMYVGYQTKFGQVEDSVPAEKLKGKDSAEISLETTNLFDLLGHFNNKTGIKLYGDFLAEFNVAIGKNIEARYYVSALPKEEITEESKSNKSKKKGKVKSVDDDEA